MVLIHLEDSVILSYITLFLVNSGFEQSRVKTSINEVVPGFLLYGGVNLNDFALP